MTAKAPRLTELKKRQLSRSKVELFCQCPQCFWLNVRKGVRQVSGPAFSLNIAVDALLKKEFDALRASGAAHPLFTQNGLDMIPYADPRLAQWTNNFQGVRWTDPKTGWTLYGAIDDLWLDRSRLTLHPSDYKATSKKDDPNTESLYPGYGRQMEIYTFLLRQQELPFPVSDRGYFYYVNGDKTHAAFDNVLQFRNMLVPRDGDSGWVKATFRAAVACASSDTIPEAGATCEWCSYRAAAMAALSPALPMLATDAPSSSGLLAA
ncbi:PD-(D/E)XK nuclease family protein [Sinimarinibacterium sp. CAU 1509]|uniref:PD-(D/E)XK nuclease family protein n=1 Tax=Sinimarinibacterium sp. CAU 1509 TaxID=2562283 RepID=UPI0010AC5CA6|nr:PD-(D/E)XK nuclease family protein [Sinimarinibacterium sp. CAU 1509]TJY57179.1 PD-(D/E)XK nuclease family protein [Sinimarinibacterium sp. CAU 1509]